MKPDKTYYVYQATSNKDDAIRFSDMEDFDTHIWDREDCAYKVILRAHKISQRAIQDYIECELYDSDFDILEDMLADEDVIEDAVNDLVCAFVSHKIYSIEDIAHDDYNGSIVADFDVKGRNDESDLLLSQLYKHFGGKYVTKHDYVCNDGTVYETVRLRVSDHSCNPIHNRNSVLSIVVADHDVTAGRWYTSNQIYINSDVSFDEAIEIIDDAISTVNW